MRWRFFVALTLATVTAGCGAAQRLATSPVEPDWLNQVQPFVNRPAPEYVPRRPEPSPYPTTAPPCRASQLRVTQGPGGVGAGNILMRVNFINVSQAPCQLGGLPQVVGLTAAGQLATLPVTGNGYFIAPIPADIAPGESGVLNIGTANSGNCPTGPADVTYRALRFELPGGGWISTDLSLTAGCGVLSISGLGKEPGPYVEPTPSPGSIGTLRATLEGFPDMARAGTTVDFVVAVANTTDLAVSLSPCPSYTMVFSPLTPTVHTFYLNCDKVTVIPHRTTVRYAMELAIPRDVAPDWQFGARFGWSLNSGFGPYAGGVIKIIN